MRSTKKIPLSLILSFAACIICLGWITVAFFRLPATVTHYLTTHEPELTAHIPFIIAMLYVGMTVAAVVLVLLVLLLRSTRRGLIFMPISGRLVFAIGCLVIAEGGVFALLGTVYLPALAITVVAVTMGLCFMVVSHVLREAAVIKDENDGTI